jgi:UDP-glucose 4-epimerase
VAVLDDLSTGSFENIAHLKHSSRFSYTIDTVFNEPVVTELVDCCDVVFHLAAAVGVRFIVESPVRTIETNVRGTEAVLKAVAKKKRRVFLASTSEVYGKNLEVPFREDSDLVLGPTSIGRWSYACSKALDEFLGLSYWREKRVPVTVVRLFNTVGPRQTGRYGMVLPTFARQAVLGEPITVHGSGEQRRCFSYVDDIVEALLRLAVTPESVGEVVNIGNDREVSILELARLVKQEAESSSEIQLVPYQEAFGEGFEDMMRRVPCVEKLERLTGYRPMTPVESIVSRVVQDVQARVFDPDAVFARAHSATGVY